MKTRTIYNERLLKFANHLLSIKEHPEQGVYETVDLFAIEGDFKIQYDMKYPIWAFEELVLVFDEWSFNGRKGNLILEGANEEEGTVAMIVDFFNLTLDELGIFDLEGFTLERHGKPLSLDASPQDIALNILQLIKTREAEE